MDLGQCHIRTKSFFKIVLINVTPVEWSRKFVSLYYTIITYHLFGLQLELFSTRSIFENDLEIATIFTLKIFK